MKLGGDRILTRSELYNKEGLEIIKVLSEYKTLYVNQMLSLFKNKDNDTLLRLINNLVKQNRVYIDKDKKVISSTEKGLYDFDISLINCFWVLLDFIDDISFHSISDYPSKIIFFTGDDVYDILYIPEHQEHIAQQLTLKQNTPYDNKKIIVIENEEQIKKLNIPLTLAYCTVNADGEIIYYKVYEDNNER